MPQLIVADTGVLSYLTKPEDRFALAYWRLLGQRTIAISFQTIAELLAAGFTPRRQAALDRAIVRTVRLPHSDETSESYARATTVRRSLRSRRRLGSDAGDADVDHFQRVAVQLAAHEPRSPADRTRTSVRSHGGNSTSATAITGLTP